MAELPSHVAQHLTLAITALLLALLAGLPLGVLAAESAALRGGVLALAGIGRTIPSLAVLMLLLPWLGVGAAPAIVALALLAIPPIVISVDVGIRGVPNAALDAATGMGMTPLQRFARVVVPLALPVSFAGLRTAATETIASATLATFIGAGGLGDEIVRGTSNRRHGAALRRRRHRRGAGARRRPRLGRGRPARRGARMKRKRALALLGAPPLLARCVFDPSAVRVGSKNFTESFVIAEIYAQALEARGDARGTPLQSRFDADRHRRDAARQHRLLSGVYGHRADRRASSRSDLGFARRVRGRRALIREALRHRLARSVADERLAGSGHDARHRRGQKASRRCPTSHARRRSCASQRSRSFWPAPTVCRACSASMADFDSATCARTTSRSSTAPCWRVEPTSRAPSRPTARSQSTISWCCATTGTSGRPTTLRPSCARRRWPRARRSRECSTPSRPRSPTTPLRG